MALYLVVINNNNPLVQRRYKYIVEATSKSEAEKKMAYADGGLGQETLDQIERTEFLASVEDGVYYVPDYIPEFIE